MNDWAPSSGSSGIGRADAGAIAFDAPPFRERRPWFGGDLQTLRNILLERLGACADLSPYPQERLTFVMPDGSGDTLVAALNRPRAAAARPLAVLLHGLTGCQDSDHLLVTAAVLLAEGYAVLRPNLRGAGPSRPLCRGQYHAGRSEDLRAILAALDPALTAHGVVLVGYSLGGNLMLKLLGEAGPAAAPVRAAVAVSAPIDLAACARRMTAPRNRGYHDYMLRRMKREALAPAAAVTPEERRRALAARTVWAFDDRFTAPHNGFGTAETYYAMNSSVRFLGAIRVPTLVIHAQDDPWIPIQAYSDFPWYANRWLVPLLPKGGGHVGFHGIGGPPPWHDLCLLRFFSERA